MSLSVLKKGIQDAQKAEETLTQGAQPTLNKSVRLERVTFSYDSHPVLTEVNLEIPAGQLTTLIGPSGSGKTTVIDLVIGTRLQGKVYRKAFAFPFSGFSLKA